MNNERKTSNISILGIPEKINQENRAEQILKTVIQKNVPEIHKKI